MIQPSLPPFANQTITILRPAVGHDHGATVPDFSAATEIPVAGCSVQPDVAEAGENLDHREASEFRCLLWAPPGTDLRASDRVRHDGITYEVKSGPQQWVDDHLGHVKATLHRWAG